MEENLCSCHKCSIGGEWMQGTVDAGAMVAQSDLGRNSGLRRGGMRSTMAILWSP